MCSDKTKKFIKIVDLKELSLGFMRRGDCKCVHCQKVGAVVSLLVPTPIV